MSKKITVCALIPTFNGYSRGYLGEALDSVCNQSISLDEIIVVDDGSTDDTANFVKKNYPNVRLISQQNSGLPSARNYGVSVAKSDLIAFLDDDDVWEKEKTARQLQRIRDCGLSIHNIILTSSLRFLVRDLKSKEWRIGNKVTPCKAWLTWPGCVLGNGVASPSGVMISRRLVVDIGGFNSLLAIGEDYEFWMRCCRHGANFSVVDVPLVRYRRHDSQMSGNIDRNFAAILPLHREFISLLPKRGHQLRANSAVVAYYLQIALRKGSKSTINFLLSYSRGETYLRTLLCVWWVFLFVNLEVIRGIASFFHLSRVAMFLRGMICQICFGAFEGLSARKDPYN